MQSKLRWDIILIALKEDFSTEFNKYIYIESKLKFSGFHFIFNMQKISVFKPLKCKRLFLFVAGGVFIFIKIT